MILVDANSLIFQVYHAIRDRMSGPSGVPTNALFGFTRDMFYLRDQKPKYLVCAFDESEITFRNEIYEEYKAHRDPMPSDLALQLPLIHDLLDALSIPGLSLAGYEADDIIATLSRAASAKGIPVWICTSDKDCRQLIDDRVEMYNLRKKQTMGRDELMEDWGITPEQVVDLQTLVGDSVDNIPGVPGVGVKTAAKLLQEFGTLENILANVDNISGKKRQENLRNASEIVELSRKLVTLSDDVPVQLEWEQWELQPWKTNKLIALLQEWGFRSMLRTVQENSNTTTVPTSTQGDLFAQPEPEEELFPFGANVANGEDLTPTWKREYHLINTPELFEKFLNDLKQQTRIAIDLETTGLDPLQCKIVGLAFSWQAEEAWYVAIRGPEGEPVLDSTDTLNALKPLLEDENIAKINQNIKYDLLVLRNHGIQLAGIVGDSMIADYLLHAGAKSHNLNDLTLREFQYSLTPITDLIGKKSRTQPQRTIDEVALDRVAQYAGEDADAAWRLCERLEAQLHEQHNKDEPSQLWTLYRELEVPLIEVLAELEFNGIRLDVPYLNELSTVMADRLVQIEKEIYELAGQEFNIGSLLQLRKILFDEMKLPVQKRTNKGAPSTDQESLEKLAALGHELPTKIVEHRQVSKLKSTYVDALPTLVNPKTNRVHTSFNQTVAATGRLSSSEPNLQNIPIRTEQGQQIRRAFLAEEGWQLLTADYSQIELRLLAHFSEDENLQKAFANDQDIHTSVAMQIFGVEESDVTSSMRRSAKTVNFGVVYGISPHGLAERLEISRDEASKFIDAYFARYPRVQEYQQRLLDDCRRDGYVPTVLGRRRYIEGIRPVSSYHQRNQPEREAINMQVQGSAADLIKLAMLNIHHRIKEASLQSRMLLQIHDELVFEMPEDEERTLKQLVQKEMIGPIEKKLGLTVPLKVDMNQGPTWLQGK